MLRRAPNSLQSLRPRLRRQLHCSGVLSSTSTSSDYKSSLNLPKTDFSMKANASVKEPKLIPQITTDLYKWQQSCRSQNEKFVLHDGPPYANGDLHCGHFLNKTLKDIINRYQLLRGKHIKYIPGWDCHGLPIELKALEKLKKKNFEELNAIEIRKYAKDHAMNVIMQQMEDFQRWGIMANWGDNNYYKTMDCEYEVAQLQVFNDMVNSKLVYRNYKPVYWSPSSVTALAEAELEYVDNHKSNAAFVEFQLLKSESNLIFNEFLCDDETSLYAVIWTTTPWSLMSNTAIAVHPDIEYSLVRNLNKKAYLVATELLDAFLETTKQNVDNYEVLSIFKGESLQGIEYQHPFDTNKQMKRYVLCGKHVTCNVGTGIVHIAPAHGMDDYQLWMSYHGNIDSCPCPINKYGHFDNHQNNSKINPSLPIDESIFNQVMNLNILKQGNSKVLELLGDSLLYSYTYKHRYPYDWRSKKPIIILSTFQWFVNVTELKQFASIALDKVKLIPETSRARLNSMLQGRDEWCISRQRSWGVPIPVFYSEDSNEVLLDDESIHHLCDVISKHSDLGTDVWYSLDESKLLSEKDQDSKWKRGNDTLDVWFDSGSSWKHVLEEKGDFPADVYLEGSDQHRGWFQSSILTYLGTKLSSYQQAENPDIIAPYKQVVTHGFVLDENNKKMSKSLGNTIEPNYFIDGLKKKKNSQKVKKSGTAYGVDVMRLWVASSNYTNDIIIGPNVIQNVFESQKKFRNTIKFMLGNLNDYSHQSTDNQFSNHLLANMNHEGMKWIDYYMLYRLNEFIRNVTTCYEDFNFRGVFSEASHFISVDISALYMDVVKDRLYCEHKDDKSRHACQMVLFNICQSLTSVMAPITLYQCEEMFQYIKAIGHVPIYDSDWKRGNNNNNNTVTSIFQTKFPDYVDLDEKFNKNDEWKLVLKLRDHVNVLISECIKNKQIQSNEESIVELIVSDPKDVQAFEILKILSTDDPTAFKSTLASVFHSSKCVVGTKTCMDVAPINSSMALSSISVNIHKSNGSKCARCRKICDSVETDLCSRCIPLI